MSREHSKARQHKLAIFSSNVNIKEGNSSISSRMQITIKSVISITTKKERDQLNPASPQN